MESAEPQLLTAPLKEFVLTDIISALTFPVRKIDPSAVITTTALEIRSNVQIKLVSQTKKIVLQQSHARKLDNSHALMADVSTLILTVPQFLFVTLLTIYFVPLTLARTQSQTVLRVLLAATERACAQISTARILVFSDL
jgi:hypothetical protein